MKKPATSRLFAVVTYIADPGQIISIICAKSKQIRSFAYILHDRDKAPPHHHLVIRTHNSKTCKQVCAWFKDDINHQNTLAAFVESPEGILAYLTHSNDPEQTQYEDSEVTDGGIADILTVANAKDTTADIIDDILAGVSYRTLVYRYGRDLVVNYNRYNDFAAMVAAQDRKESEETDENPVPASPNYTKFAFCIIRGVARASPCWRFLIGVGAYFPLRRVLRARGGVLVSCHLMCVSCCFFVRVTIGIQRYTKFTKFCIPQKLNKRKCFARFFHRYTKLAR